MAVRINNFVKTASFEWGTVLLCMAFIFMTSSLPAKDIPPLFKYQDILYHAIIYAILIFLFSRALHKTAPAIKSMPMLALAVLFGVIFGASDEFHQLFVSGRSCSGSDLLVDGIGSFLGGIAYNWLK